MNLDLLKKLTRLANNNPNDNEANSAARRVCKMLEEGNWSLNGQQTRTTQPDFKSTRPTESPFPDGFAEIFERMQREQRERAKQTAYAREEAYQREKAKEAKYQHVHDDFDPYNTPRSGYWENVNRADNPFWRTKDGYKPPSQQKEKRDLKCRTCGKVVHTPFVGVPEMFECNTCQWTAYQRDKV